MVIIDFISGMAEDTLQKIKKDPEKYRNFISAAVAVLDTSTEMLKESPEFRRAFARVHSEFLRYPESRETIEQAFQAQQEFVPDFRTSGLEH